MQSYSPHIIHVICMRITENIQCFFSFFHVVQMTASYTLEKIIYCRITRQKQTTKIQNDYPESS